MQVMVNQEIIRILFTLSKYLFLTTNWMGRTTEFHTKKNESKMNNYHLSVTIKRFSKKTQKCRDGAYNVYEHNFRYKVEVTSCTITITYELWPMKICNLHEHHETRIPAYYEWLDRLYYQYVIMYSSCIWVYLCLQSSLTTQRHTA